MQGLLGADSSSWQCCLSLQDGMGADAPNPALKLKPGAGHVSRVSCCVSLFTDLVTHGSSAIPHDFPRLCAMIPFFIPWLVLGCVVLIVVGGLWKFVVFFRDMRVKSTLSTLTSVSGLALGFICLLIIPIDILNAAHEGREAYSQNAEVIKLTYYACYGLLLGFNFVLVPFAYFYCEEERLEDEPDNRLTTSLKYTAVSLLVVLGVVAIATVLAFRSSEPAADLDSWAQQIREATDGGQKAVQVLIGMMALLGLAGWLLYAAFGMAYLPLALWKGGAARDVGSAVESSLADVEDGIREIEAKGLLTGVRPGKEDQARLDVLRAQQRRFERRRRMASRLSDESVAWGRDAWAPVLRLVAVVVGGMVLVLVLSILLSALTRGVPLAAGNGLVVFGRDLPNPLDTLLVVSSRAFPLDCILLCCMLLVVFASALAAVTRLGVWFMWLRLYKLRRSGTPPQGLLLTCVILTFIVVTFSLSSAAITPQYIAFGPQTIVKGGAEYDCKFEDACSGADCDDCRLTQLAALVNAVARAFPIFDMAYCWSQWGFCLVFLISVVVCMLTDTPSVLESAYDSEDENSELFFRLPSVSR